MSNDSKTPLFTNIPPDNLPDFNLMQEILKDQLNKIWYEREKQVLEALEKAGYSFSSQEEKELFAKTRLTMVRHKEKPNEVELFVDYFTPNKQLICWWDETVKIEQDGYNTNITVGK
jgi:hypothetical protein